jgi:hypothetical protein
VQLERELLWVGVGGHVPGVPCVGDRRLERHQPLGHKPGDLVAYRAGPAVELDRGRDQEATAAENLALHVVEPGIGERKDLVDAAVGAGSAEDLVNEHLACRPDGLDLKIDLRPEVREKAALAYAKRLGEATDGETL